jgi:putative two-component system hydrogenase maturation factor HypX/HoxX
MRILLLVSAFNGLTQRVWCHLREEGHDVGVELAPVHEDPDDLTRAVEAAEPDLILCPFLKHRVPADVYERWPTIIIHPGPVGDRGPSSLDHAIRSGRDRWGVTALSAVEQMDAGPIWATSLFDMPTPPIAKSALYNGRVADAALSCVDQVLREVTAGEQPVPARRHPKVIKHTAELPLLRRAAFEIDWEQPAGEIARRIAAADGAPGAPATLAGRRLCLYDAVAIGDDSGAAPGTVVAHDTDAVAIACGHGTLWVGYAAELGDKRGPKLPASMLIDATGTPFRALPEEHAETSYERVDDVGILTFRSYNGAMHTEQCRRLATAVEKALVEDTRVLVLRGTEHAFSNGIHLGVIDAAEDPAQEAWDNIRAIDEVCLLLASAEQLTVAAFTANAGAGGVMMGLCADVTLAREGVVLNPHYDMGIFGSELHTWALPTRVGDALSRELLEAKLPLAAARAREIGMVADIGPREAESFDRWLRATAAGYVEPATYDALVAARDERRAHATPLSFHQAIELAEMGRDIFEDRRGFAAQRRDFVRKAAPAETPARLQFR